ncbi:MAG: outer membrane protein assembly factor BamE [Rhodocyclaceae bacterium]|nr:outer membrane protein assembly factor BamE [Rhodocyclaceae bacterium]
MRFLILKLCALLSMLGLYACDSSVLQQLRPGISTEAEIRALMGEPGMEWKNGDGGRTWEYSRQPEGMMCYMLTLDPNGILRGIEQVLTPENLARVRPGMSKEEIRRLLGKPRSVQVFPLKPEEVWDWKVGQEMGTDQLFNVHFDVNGQVTGTSRSQKILG